MRVPGLTLQRRVGEEEVRRDSKDENLPSEIKSSCAMG
jgi:hypothetical protein